MRTLLLVIGLGLALPARADEARPPMLRDVGLEQHLGATVPLDLAFRDEDGRSVTLGQYFRGRPVVLSLVYHGCAMLCAQTQNGLAASLKTLSLDVGRDFTVLTVSFDAKDGPESAREKKAAVLPRYGRPGASDGWHFLTGDEAAIARLTAAVGFRYTRDAAGEQFAHVPATIVLTPEGRISRYFSSLEPPPRDLRLALVEASANRIGTLIDRILLFCYHYDPASGKYTVLVMNAVRAGGAFTLLALGTFLAVMWRREARGR